MTTSKRPLNHGFSLIEVLLVLAIISIMAAMVINAFSNAAQDSRNVLARQQQAALQSAVNNWTSSQIGRLVQVDTDADTIPDTTFRMSVERTRNRYNYLVWWTDPVSTAASNDRKAAGRLTLIQDYLDEDTYQHFVNNSPAPADDATKVRSNAMVKTSQYLELPKWASPSAGNANPYPKVDLYP